MQILGIDFTSDPRPHKPITVARGHLKESVLTIDRVERLINYQSFALLLHSPGPWIAAIDFPFGQPERLIDAMGWPRDWSRFVALVASMGKSGFRSLLDVYRANQPVGDKEHPRVIDRIAKATGAMKVYGTPVGLMFCEGAPFLLLSGASVPPMLPDRDPNRVIVEAYAQLVVRKIVGRISYKTDDVKRRSEALMEVRQSIVTALVKRGATAPLKEHYGFHVRMGKRLIRSCVVDHSGDTLDAVLCGVQAAWAQTQSEQGYGIPVDASPLEGWIADPGNWRP